MLVGRLARQGIVGGQSLVCSRYRHPDTKPSDHTTELQPDQKLVQLPLRQAEKRITSVTIG